MGFSHLSHVAIAKPGSWLWSADVLTAALADVMSLIIVVYHRLQGNFPQEIHG